MKRPRSFSLILAIAILSRTLMLRESLASQAAPTVPLPVPGEAANTYYVRTDGGSNRNCTGLVDAAYPGGGSNQPCAWNHPFRAFPPGGTPRIAGGDTLIIRAGKYRMGLNAPGASNCDAAGAFDCVMPPVPSGPDASHPTRVLGAGWDSGCAKPPQLWGAERPWYVLNLTDSSNVEVGCLEITDHSDCVEFHTGGLACERDDPPYGDWAAYGLYAEDSDSVYLHDLNIHGLAGGGVHAGRLSNWTVEDVRVVGNGWVGWDGDLWDDDGDSNSGALTFRRFSVEWNGCGETYPDQQPTGCWAQTAGGYGDGFATGRSGGNWLIEDSSIRYNTSDGLDFLYVSEPGSSVTIRRTIVEGNAGNQVKNYRGPFTLQDSIVVGNCGFFDGQPFTHDVDNCRALGVALAIGLTRGGQATVTHNTLTSEGDCLVTAECSSGNCNGTENVLLQNNIYQGQTDFLQPFEKTCLVYQETFPSDPFTLNYSLINNVKDDACPGDHNLCGVSPGLANLNMDRFNADLSSDSPAIDAGNNAACTASDWRGLPRPQDGDGNGSPVCDMGAIEYKPPVRATLRSEADYDGWILESAETSKVGGTLDADAATLYVGDDATDRQYRAILSFNTSSLPDDAILARVTLKIKFEGTTGTNPFETHGALSIDIRRGAFSGNAALQLKDFQSPASKKAVGAFKHTAVNKWYSRTWKSGIFPFISLTGVTQFRLRFQKGDDDDRNADFLRFFSGNAAASDRPKLVIVYYVP